MIRLNHDHIRADLKLWRRTTTDREIHAWIDAALKAGPGTEPWSTAVCALGVHRLGEHELPRPDWQAGVWRRVSQSPLASRIWDRAWAYLLAVAAAVLFAIAITALLTRWS